MAGGLFLSLRGTAIGAAWSPVSRHRPDEQFLQARNLYTFRWPCAPHRRHSWPPRQACLRQASSQAASLGACSMRGRRHVGRRRGAGDRPVAPSGRSGPADAGHTHFGELHKAAEYAIPASRTGLGGLLISRDSFSPTYQLQWGIPGRQQCPGDRRALGSPLTCIGASATARPASAPADG